MWRRPLSNAPAAAVNASLVACALCLVACLRFAAVRPIPVGFAMNLVELRVRRPYSYE